MARSSARTRSDRPLPVHSFLAGASSGMVAAAVTTPFDVVKTHMQAEVYKGGDASRQPAAGAVATARRVLAAEGTAPFAVEGVSTA